MGGGGLDPSQNPKYSTQTLARLCASEKFLQKNVFLRPFWSIFRTASGIFRKVALPRFLEVPTFVIKQRQNFLPKLPYGKLCFKVILGVKI